MAIDHTQIEIAQSRKRLSIFVEDSDEEE